MGVQIGKNIVPKFYVGTNEVQAIYHGEAVVYQKELVPPPLIAPTITSVTLDKTSPKVGDVISYAAVVGGNPTPTLALQWLLDGGVIIGATGSTYTVVSGNVGGRISLRVTASNGVDPAAVLTSAQTLAVPSVQETYTTPQYITILDQQYKRVGANAEHSARVFSPSGAIRFEVRPGDKEPWDAVDQERAQYDGYADVWPAATNLIKNHFKFRLDSTIAPVPWLLPFEWHHDPSKWSGSPPIAYIFEYAAYGIEGALYAVRRDSPNPNTTPFTKIDTHLITLGVGEEVDIQEEIKFDPTNGIWKITVNGVVKLNWTGRVGYPGMYNYPEFGGYRGSTPNKTSIITFTLPPQIEYAEVQTPPKPTAAAYLSSLDNPMGAQEQTNITNWFTALDNAGVLSVVNPGTYAAIYNTTTLDGALTNTMNPTAPRAVRSGTVNHSPKNGMTPAGGVIDTNNAITLSDDFYFIYVANDAADGAAQAGDAQYTNALAIFGNYLMAGMNNDSQVYPGRTTTFPASLAVRRISATQVEIYVNGTLFQTVAMDEQVLAGTYNWLVGGAGTPAQTTTARIIGAMKGPALTPSQILAVHNAYNNLRTAQAALA